MYFPKVYFPKVYFPKVYFPTNSIFQKCIFRKCIASMQVFWVQTFSTQRLPSPNFFKLSVPGGLRIFRAFASLFLLFCQDVQLSHEQSERFHIQFRGHKSCGICNSSQHFVSLFGSLSIDMFQWAIVWTSEGRGAVCVIVLVKTIGRYWYLHEPLRERVRWKKSCTFRHCRN